ncbi:MAG: amino-acid N-acetyltransferase [Methylacidiphilales bacterium]|nr:amino-acid N-acetyltransferase [Candidatus Methylacidiphilales bacterium]MDW8349460.1 amino-acid N-acetyltransferase [Verrucomicrobiae bacterium]
MNVTDLRGILTYIPQFREKTFVIAMDGIIAAHENFTNIVLDLAVLRSLNIKLILVHGISHQLKQIAQATGTTISNADGTGITDATTLDLAITAANRLTHEILEGLASSDLRAANTNAVIAHPLGIISGVDHQYTGKVERIDLEYITTLLDKGIIPVLPPLGFDGDGRTFRVNSDSVALSVAESLKATKIIFLTEHNGLYKQDKLITQMSIAEAEEYAKKYKNEIPQALVSKLDHSIRACRNGVSRSHIINGRVDEALLSEIFSAEGVGTMIYANEYAAIRRALKKDIRSILSLVRESVQAEELIKRSKQDILQKISDYYVYEIDRNIVGCVALHPYPNDNKAEMACLYVSRSHENQGIGKKLMLFVENLARERGYKQIFALSTQAFNYFQQKGGYLEATPDILPEARREKYDSSKRNSKVLVKNLTS